METKKDVGLWIRVSSIMQVDRESDLHHEIRGKEFIKARGYNAKKIYRLPALSGGSIMDYDETKRMLADIKSNTISGLVFSQVSRLARNTMELIQISKLFEAVGADLISMDMQIDTSTPMGRHFFRQQSSQSELELEMIRARITNSVLTRAQLGKHLGGQPPFGFKYVDKRLVPHEEEAPILKLMFQTFLENKRKRTTATKLNEQGYRTKRGNKFNDSTVKRLLTDPVAKGIQIMNRRYSKPKNGQIFKPKEEWVFHKVEPVVSVELFDKVNEIISEQSKTNAKPLNNLVHLFTGIVYCECGGKMYTRSNSVNYLCHNHCGNKIRKDDIEEIFRHELHSYTVSQNDIESYFDKIQSVLGDKQKQLSKLKKEKELLDKKIENLLELHSQGQIKTESFHTYHQKPYEQLTQVEKTIAELEGAIGGYSSQENATQQIIEEAKNLYERWDTLSHEQKRNIIETIVEKIVIAKDEITIDLYKILPDGYYPPSSEFGTNGHHTLNSVVRTAKRT